MMASLLGGQQTGPLFAMVGGQVKSDAARWAEADADELAKIGAAGIWIAEQDVPHEALLHGCVTRREQKRATVL